MTTQTGPAHVETRRDGVRVRKSPDARGEILGVMYHRDRTAYAGESVKRRRTTYHRVTYNDEPGWINGKYAKLV